MRRDNRVSKSLIVAESCPNKTYELPPILIMMFMTLLIPLMTVMVAATDSHEEHSLQCSSLPSFDNSDIYIYFGCSCRENEK